MIIIIIEEKYFWIWVFISIVKNSMLKRSSKLRDKNPWWSPILSEISGLLAWNFIQRVDSAKDVFRNSFNF